MGLRTIAGQIRTALALKRLADAFEKEKAMNHDWAKTLKAAATDFLLTAAAVLAAYFSDPAALAAALGLVPEHLRLALVPILSALFVALRKRIKHGGPPNPDLKAGALAGLFLIFGTIANAQTPAPSTEGLTLTLHGGAMQFAERGQPDRRDFVYRLTLAVPAPHGLTLSARADYTRTQDGGDLLDPHTFRSVEAFAAARKKIATNLEAVTLGGVSWNRDAKFEPVDPRLWTAAAGARFTVPGRGYVILAAGHHGPVGGAAGLVSIVYDLEASGAASWFLDAAVPLDADRFRSRPYTVKAGISARLKGWKF